MPRYSKVQSLSQLVKGVGMKERKMWSWGCLKLVGLPRWGLSLVWVWVSLHVESTLMDHSHALHMSVKMTRMSKLAKVLLPRAGLSINASCWLVSCRQGTNSSTLKVKSTSLYHHFVLKRTKCQMTGQIHAAFSFNCCQTESLRHGFDMRPQQ